ncbi:hypothetical protein D307_gp6 [Bacillus phage Bastille]|uniref:Uncharacterized protein n=1 Tax=Bacillus phage Bastille TaxID=57477 RepID=L7V0W2_9CAUD|nr:hypothetical protein D307_gp6 [Bacillus phage Bastille]AGC55700.1 hypothetical protein [Bacillus phage Bastille]
MSLVCSELLGFRMFCSELLGKLSEYFDYQNNRQVD